MAKTTVELPEGLHRTVRVKAALENRSMNDIMLDALRAYLQNFRLESAVLEVETVPAHSEQATQSESTRQRSNRRSRS